MFNPPNIIMTKQNKMLLYYFCGAFFMQTVKRKDPLEEWIEA